jgi:peptidoglycan/xylan/chitin deacetylase (PgdA/CDA1 family)
MNYLAHLIRSKGFAHLGQRALAIGRRYGMSPGRIVQAFERLVGTLEQYGCRATFPTTAVALARNPAPIRQLQEQGMELAVHGLTHVNLGRYSVEQQAEYLSRALDIFDQHGISAEGFRSPYLQRGDAIRETVEAAGFRYLSNEPILWDGIGGAGWSRESVRAYQQAVDFYVPLSSAEHPSLPTVRGRMIEIPVSLPDDEMLVERLRANGAQIAQIWTQILHQTYARSELFTVQLHPERAMICAPALSHVLSEARSCNPPVWIACLGEIADWWERLQAVRVAVTYEDHDRYVIAVRGPAQASVLVRSAQVIGESETWGDGYQLVRSRHFAVQCSSRPVVGVSTRTSEAVIAFLEGQGYVLEIGEKCNRYAAYLDRPRFIEEDGRLLLQEIEISRSPLIRVSRWPGNARSALAITGDIDALTLWDYGLRSVGK